MSARLVSALSFLLVSPALAVEVVWDFEDGTLQRWESLGSTTAPMTLAPSSGGYLGSFLPSGSSVHVAPAPESARDGDHDTLLLRSPPFRVNGDADISVWMMGGMSAGDALTTVLPAGPADLATSTMVDDGLHVMGVALRRVSDDVYLMTGQRSTAAESYEEIVWSAVDLEAFDEELVTIDVFDSYASDWGWVAVDEVVVDGLPTLDVGAGCPGPTDIAAGYLSGNGRVAILRGSGLSSTAVPGGPHQAPRCAAQRV